MTRFNFAAKLMAMTALMVVHQGLAMAQMPAQQPDAKSFKLGKFDIVALHDAQFVKPNEGSDRCHHVERRRLAGEVETARCPD